MDPNHGGNPTQTNFAPPRGYALTGKIMLSTIMMLFTVVLVFLFLHLYIRCYLVRRTRRPRRLLIFTAEHRTPPVSRGLDPGVLKSLPVFVYSSSESDSPECAVCLNEFVEGEKVRRLPRCNHGFHIECIDMWFYSHATCPLCRSAVEPEASVPVTVSMQIPVSDYPLPPPLSRSDLCCSCRHEEGFASSSSSSSGGGMLGIEVPPRRGDVLRSTEEEVGSGSGLGSGSPAVKSPGSRMLLLKRLLSRDLRFYRGGGSGNEVDLERGEGESPPAPPPRE